MYAISVNAYIWKSPLRHYIDKTLSKYHFKLLSLPWNQFELLDNDSDHFTWTGYKNFCKSLKMVVDNNIDKDSSLYFLSDSTIDYWNYKDNGAYNGKANKYLKKILNRSNIKIDALCGSGFYSFNKRVNNAEDYDNIFIIGGWNDNSYQSVKKYIKQISSKRLS